MSLNAPVVAITGASSGLGEVFARKLAARGWNLMLVARREERLRQLAAEFGPARVEVLPADLAHADECARVASRLRSEERLDLLINNAGFGSLGWFHESDLQRQIEMHQVHVMATLRLTRAALEGMVARDRGGIINVSSVAGFAHSPGNVSYCASKAWIHHFSEGLRVEMDKLGSRVMVQALCPGFTYTEFHDVMGIDRRAIPRFFWMKADYVVEESLRGLERGDLFVIPSWKYRWFVALWTKLPARLRLALERRSPHKRV